MAEDDDWDDFLTSLRAPDPAPQDALNSGVDSLQSQDQFGHGGEHELLGTTADQHDPSAASGSNDPFAASPPPTGELGGVVDTGLGGHAVALGAPGGDADLLPPPAEALAPDAPGQAAGGSGLATDSLFISSASDSDSPGSDDAYSPLPDLPAPSARPRKGPGDRDSLSEDGSSATDDADAEAARARAAARDSSNSEAGPGSSAQQEAGEAAHAADTAEGERSDMAAEKGAGGSSPRQSFLDVDGIMDDISAAQQLSAASVLEGGPASADIMQAVASPGAEAATAARQAQAQVTGDVAASDGADASTAPFHAAQDTSNAPVHAADHVDQAAASGAPFELDQRVVTAPHQSIATREDGDTGDYEMQGNVSAEAVAPPQTHAQALHAELPPAHDSTLASDSPSLTSYDVAHTDAVAQSQRDAAPARDSAAAGAQHNAPHAAAPQSGLQRESSLEGYDEALAQALAASLLEAQPGEPAARAEAADPASDSALGFDASAAAGAAAEVDTDVDAQIRSRHAEDADRAMVTVEQLGGVGEQAARFAPQAAETSSDSIRSAHTTPGSASYTADTVSTQQQQSATAPASHMQAQPHTQHDLSAAQTQPAQDRPVPAPGSAASQAAVRQAFPLDVLSGVVPEACMGIDASESDEAPVSALLLCCFFRLVLHVTKVCDRAIAHNVKCTCITNSAVCAFGKVPLVQMQYVLPNAISKSLSACSAATVEGARQRALSLMRAVQHPQPHAVARQLDALLATSGKRTRDSWPERGRPDPVRDNCMLGGQLALEVTSTVIPPARAACTCSCAAPVGWDASRGEVLRQGLLALGYASGDVELLFNFQDGAGPTSLAHLVESTCRVRPPAAHAAACAN